MKAHYKDTHMFGEYIEQTLTLEVTQNQNQSR